MLISPLFPVPSTLTHGIGTVCKIIRSDWGREYVKREIWPKGTDLETSFDYYLHKGLSVGNHQIGTAQLGKATDLLVRIKRDKKEHGEAGLYHTPQPQKAPTPDASAYSSFCGTC